MNSSEWNYIDATTFCGKVTDGTHDSPKRKEVGRPLITSKHIKGHSVDFENAYLIGEEDFKKINQRSRVDQWDVLISMIGEYCGYCYVEKSKLTDYAVKNVGIFKVGDETKAKWIYYYLNSPDGRNTLSSLRSGTSQPYLSLGALRSLPILVPKEKATMEKIVSILSSLDDKIELNRQTAATLEAVAQALFNEWFVEFQFPGASGVMEERNGVMVPREWRVGKLGDVCELAYGKALKAEIRIPGDYPVVGSSGVVDSHNEFLVKGPGIVVGRKGTIGETTWLHTHFFPIDTTFYIVDKLGVKGLYFHYFLLQEQDFKKIGSDSAVPGLNRNEAYSSFVMIPLQELVVRFNEIAKPIFDELETLEQQTKTLAQLRDGLLPRLMRGDRYERKIVDRDTE